MRQVGGYALEALIGRGGMGEVWRARQVRLDRPAAVKLVRPDTLGPSAEAATLLRRFEREAQATSRLRSPHTVEVFDFGTTPDGVFWYAMEHLAGLDLKTLVLRHGPLPPARVVHCLRQACTSLAEAHAAGLLHRDIKPANLFASTLGVEHDVIKVLDFGLVKPLVDADASQLTDSRAVPGSPAFMAPEAIQGAAVDARADLYALGCVGWWLLTGQLVFPGRASSMALLMAHLNEVPPAVDTRASQPVPPGLVALIARLLAKAPEARFESALALSDALDALPGPRWTQAEARGWWAAHPLPAEAPGLGPADVSSGDLQAARSEAMAALEAHFQESRLVPAEFERRARAVALADHPDALGPLLADLPGLERSAPVPVVVPHGAPAEVPVPAAAPTALAPRGAKRPRWMVGAFGGIERKGGWRPQPAMRCLGFFGGVELDFTQADLPAGEIHVHAVAIFGGVELRVPHDVPVIVEGVGLFGGFAQSGVKALPAPDGAPPTVIRVTGVACFGGVDVKVVDPAKKGFFRRLIDEVFDDT